MPKRRMVILKDYEEMEIRVRLSKVNKPYHLSMLRLRMLEHFTPERTDRQLVNLAERGERVGKTKENRQTN